MIESVLALSDKELSLALFDAKREDEFDEALPSESGLRFEEQCADAAGRLGIVLQVMYHSASSTCELLQNVYYHREVAVLLSLAWRRMPTQLMLAGILAPLLKIKHGGEMVVAIVRNCPEDFAQVLELVVASGNAGVLNMMAELSELCAIRVRDALVSEQMFPDLVLHLTLHTIRDPIQLVEATLRSECSWIRIYFQAHQEKENSLAARIRGLLLHDDPELRKSAARFGHYLNLLTGVCGMWGLRTSPGSSQRIVNALVASCKSSSHVALQGMAFLLVCEGLSKMLPPQILIDCIGALLRSPAANVAALVAVRFSLKALALNAAWCKATAGVPVSIQSESFQLMAAAWREMLPEPKLVRRVLELEPVQGLRRGCNEDAAVLAVMELMVGHSFIRARVDPASWVSQQIGLLARPLHACVLDFVASFVAGSCNISSSFHYAPIPAERMIELTATSEALQVRLVASYLALSHNSMVRRMGSHCVTAVYSSETIEQFGLKRLLRDAQGQGMDILVEKLSVVCMSECPEIMVADQMWFVLREEPLVATWKRAESGLASGEEVSVDELCGIILPRVLSQGASDEAAHVFFGAQWRRAYRLSPTAVALATMRVLRDQHVTGKSLSSSNMISDPLMLLRVKEAVFQCPEVFGILLELINVYSTASRKRFWTAMAPLDEDSPDRHGLGRLAIMQDCAIAQLVIELCSKYDRPIQLLCCSFLHQLFISHPATLELLHHQGYAPDALEVLVDNVPSLHVCLDLLPVLLCKDDMELRLFATKLASHLFVRYATPQALEIARDMLVHLMEQARMAPVETRQFLGLIQESLGRILSVFPVLLDEFVETCEYLGTSGRDAFIQVAPIFDLPTTEN